MTVRTKICGIGCAANLAAAVSAGADAVGFIVATTHESEDELAVQQAHELACATPVFVGRVLVTHTTDPDAILQLADDVGADVIQVHGVVNRRALRSVWRRRCARHEANVAEAIHFVRPFGVDANSRLKDAHGRKDAAACAAFVAATY